MKININIDFDKLKVKGELVEFKQFLERNFKRIIIVMILLLGYIQSRYEYEQRLIHIADLKHKRSDVRYISIEKWGVLTKYSRPEVIRERIANGSTELIESDEPPVKID